MNEFIFCLFFLYMNSEILKILKRFFVLLKYFFLVASCHHCKEDKNKSEIFQYKNLETFDFI